MMRRRQEIAITMLIPLFVFGFGNNLCEKAQEQYLFRRIQSSPFFLKLYPLSIMPSTNMEWKTPDGLFVLRIEDGVLTLKHQAWEVIEGMGRKGRKIWFNYYSLGIKATNNSLEIEETRSPKASQPGISPKPEDTISISTSGKHLKGFIYTTDLKYGTKRPAFYIIVSDEFAKEQFLEWDPFAVDGEIERLLIPDGSPTSVNHEYVKEKGYFIRVISESTAKEMFGNL